MVRHSKASEVSLPLLALGSLGASSVWSTEMAFAAPFLLHLGIPKSNMAFVFIAGPLSGLLVQPIIGVLTDNSTSKWGRRRPALAVGCLLCALSMLILGFARPIASIFTSIEPAQTNLTIAAVVFSIFAIDFSVNAVCALDRTLILDLVHSSQQSLANVWAARLSGMGAILGFFIGQNDLTRLAPFTWLPSIFASGAELDSSEAQLRCVCVLVVVLLLSTHVVTMIVAKESPALPNPSHRMRDSQSNWQLIVVSMILAWTGLVKVARGLSRPILELFRAQFFLAMAWFPFMFYSTSWVSGIAQGKDATMTPAAAMRLGSSSLLIQASISFICTLILPNLLQFYNRRFPNRSIDSLTVLWSAAAFTLAIVFMSTKLAERKESTNLAILIIGLTGFSGCLSAWAPYAILGILLQKGAQGEALVSYIDRSKDYDDLSKYGRHTEDGAPLMQRSFSSGIDDDSIDEGGFQKEVDTSASRRSSEAPLQSGTISGLHNVIIVVPQFIMTALTSIVFSYLSSEGGGKASEAANFGFILRLGGIAALVSSFYSFRLARRYSDFLEG